LLFYNALDLNNQKILWLPSIYEFERTGTNLNHPKIYLNTGSKTQNVEKLSLDLIFYNNFW
jgi:hypothetical protein